MSKLETNTIDTLSGTTNLTIGSTNSSTVTIETGGSERMRINSDGQLLMQNGSLFSGSIKNMSVVDMVINTGTGADTYVTREDGGVTIYGSSHTFSYGFTAADADKVAFAAHQVNHNNGGHFSKNQFDFRSRSTTGATLLVSDRANSASVDMRIICLEYA